MTPPRWRTQVRRAGYAYRAEYWRFLERFKHLSRRTYPHWSGGSEKKGCQYILKVGVIMTAWR